VRIDLIHFSRVAQVKLVQSSLAFGMGRLGPGGGVEMAADVDNAYVRDETDTVIVGCAHPHMPCTKRLLERFGLKSKFEAAFPFISEAGKSSECVIAVLLLAGAAGGFIGSVVGTSRRVACVWFDQAVQS
jgi:hypothetical protein